MIDADADPPFVALKVVHAIGDRFPLLGNQEVVYADWFGIAGGPPLPSRVLEVPNQLLLFRIYRDRRLTALMKTTYLVVDVMKLRIAVLMLRAFARFLIRLQAIAELVKQVGHGSMADVMSHLVQRFAQIPYAPGSPTQRRLRISQSERFHQRVKIGQQRRICFTRRLTAAPWTSVTAHIQLRAGF